MLKECLRALWRRRVLSTLAVLVALGTGALAFVAVPPTQHSTAQVLFVPSVKQPGVEGPTNPFMAMTGAVAIVASVVQAQASDDRTASELADAGHTAKYEVTPNLAENAGPILLIDVTDPSVQNSSATRDAVIARIQDDLQAIQAEQGIDTDLLVRSVVLTSSPKPVVVHKNQIKLAVLGSVAALGFLVVLILLVERRRIARLARRGPTAVEPAAPASARKGRPASPARADRHEEPDLRARAEPVGVPARGSSSRGTR